MTLEKKLACLRKREGLSQAEVSEKLDVSWLFRIRNNQDYAEEIVIPKSLHRVL